VQEKEGRKKKFYLCIYLFSQDEVRTLDCSQRATAGCQLDRALRPLVARQPAIGLWSPKFRRPVVVDHWSEAKANWQPRPYQVAKLTTFKFFNLRKKKIGLLRKFGDGPSILGEWVDNTPIF
jgi:hypothetical protein